MDSWSRGLGRRDDRALYQLYVRYMQQANDYLLANLRSERARQHLLSFHQPLPYEEFRTLASPERLGAQKRADIEATLTRGFRTEVTPSEREATRAWLRSMVA